MWSTFTTESPMWRDDDPVTTAWSRCPPSRGVDPAARRPERSTARARPTRVARTTGHATVAAASTITGGYDAAYGARDSSGGGTGEIHDRRGPAHRREPHRRRAAPGRAASRVGSRSAPTPRACRRRPRPGRRGGPPSRAPAARRPGAVRRRAAAAQHAGGDHRRRRPGRRVRRPRCSWRPAGADRSSSVVLAIAGVRVLRQGHREGVPPGRRRRGRRVRRRAARRLLGRRAAACRW